MKTLQQLEILENTMRRTLLATALLACAAGVSAIETGPEVGTPIPHFETHDQHGDVRTFEDLRGPEGLLLLFYRTVDW